MRQTLPGVKDPKTLPRKRLSSTRGSTGRASVGFASFRAPVSHNVMPR